MYGLEVGEVYCQGFGSRNVDVSLCFVERWKDDADSFSAMRGWEGEAEAHLAIAPLNLVTLVACNWGNIMATVEPELSRLLTLRPLPVSSEEE
jgi:hypothetical protein